MVDIVVTTGGVLVVGSGTFPVARKMNEYELSFL